MKPKALIITALFGNQKEVGKSGVGAIRISHIAKAMKEEFDVTILTMKGQESEEYDCIAKSDNSSWLNQDKLPFFSMLFYRLIPVEQHIFWFRKLKKDILANKDYYSRFDLIYINSPPFIISLLGEVFKSINSNCKIIIDFRDTWAYAGFNQSIFIRPISLIDRHLNKARENKAIKAADKIIFVTPINYNTYANVYGDKVLYYPNGYDPKLLESIKQKDISHEMAYAGDFHSGRDVSLILEVLKESFPDKKLNCYGNFSWFTRSKLKEYKNSIRYNKRISRSQLFQELYNSKILIVLQGLRSYSDKVSYIALKTYEYLALGKPIIYIGIEGDNAQIIRRYAKHNLIITNLDQRDNVKKKIEEFIKTHESSIGEKSEEFIRKYDVDSMSSGLAKKLKKLVSQ